MESLQVEAPGGAALPSASVQVKGEHGHGHTQSHGGANDSFEAGPSLRHVGRARSWLGSHGDELRPFPTVLSRCQLLLPPKFIGLVIACIAASAFTHIVAAPKFEILAEGSPCEFVSPSGEGSDGALCATAADDTAEGQCVVGLSAPLPRSGGGPKLCPLAKQSYRAEVPPWKAYLVVNGLVLAMGALVLGAPVVTVMMVTNAVLVVCKVITEKEALAGFGNPGILALALLFILAAAVERSGLLEPVVDKIMGDGKNPGLSRVRLIVMVMAMSAFINNTPLCAMMMPFVLGWSNRHGEDPFDFLIPLAYATSAGGCLARISSPPNIIVFTRYQHTMGEEMDFFMTAPIGLLCCAAYALYTLLLAPRLLAASVRPPPIIHVEKPTDGLYSVRWVVTDDSELVGCSWRGRGLLRLSNTTLTKVIPWEGGRRVAANKPGAGGADAEDLSRYIFRSGDELITVSDAHEVTRLRHVRGLFITGEAGEAIRRLGQGRRERALFECLCLDERALTSGSGVSPSASPTTKGKNLRRVVLEQFGAAIIAHRGSPADAAGVVGQSVGAGGSQIVLVEAPAAGFETKVEACFALVRQVPKSTPPRVGRKEDPCRAKLAAGIVAGVIGFCVLVAMPQLPIGDLWMKSAPLATLCVLAGALILALDILTYQEAMGSINATAFCGIAASCGLGTAMEKTGVARAFALGLVALAKSAGLGYLGICGGVMIAACALSNVLSNSAVAVLVMPIAENIAKEESIDLRLLACLVIYSANFAFATPFATASNLMVMAPLGPRETNYAFMDYARFGGPLQVLLVITAMIGVQIFWGSSAYVDGGASAAVAAGAGFIQ